MPSWERLADLPQTGSTGSGSSWGLRNQPGAAFVNSKIYLSGGSSQWTGTRYETYEYNPTTNVWTLIVDGSNNPVLCPHRHVYCGATGLNGLFAIYGGSGYSSDYTNAWAYLDLYDPTTKTWTTAELPTYAMGGSNMHHVGGNVVLTYNNKLYSFGGTQGLYQDAQNKAWVYNPAASAGARWSTTATWASTGVTGRKGQVGVVYGSKAYLFGGMTDAAVRTANTLIYDFGSNSWTTGASAPATFDATVAGVIGTNIAVVINGGTYYYTPATDSWSGNVATSLTAFNSLYRGPSNGAYCSDGTYVYALLGDGSPTASAAFYDANMVAQRFSNIVLGTGAAAGAGSLAASGIGAILGASTLSGVGDLSLTDTAVRLYGPYLGAVVTIDD